MWSQKHLQHVVLLLLSGVILSSANDWSASFDPNDIVVTTITAKPTHLTLTGLSEFTIANIQNRQLVRIGSDDIGVAAVYNHDQIVFYELGTGIWHANITINGVFLGKFLSKLQFLSYLKSCFTGRTAIFVEIITELGVVERSTASLVVTTLRPERIIDTLFYVAIIVLLAILFVNFGCALDKKIIIAIMKRPVGPAIGSLCQIGFLPLIAYGLGVWLFPNHPEMALGLFMTGITPAGGASNIYALLLNGNINLSISMTTISTLASFGTMPLWLFLLGRQIFYRANLSVPYARVAIVAFSLLGPLCLGILIQKFFPRLAKFLVSILKMLSLIFMILIVIFGLITNLYMFQMFEWEVIV